MDGSKTHSVTPPPPPPLRRERPASEAKRALPKAKSPPKAKLPKPKLPLPGDSPSVKLPHISIRPQPPPLPAFTQSRPPATQPLPRAPVTPVAPAPALPPQRPPKTFVATTSDVPVQSKSSTDWLQVGRDALASAKQRTRPVAGAIYRFGSRLLRDRHQLISAVRSGSSRGIGSCRRALQAVSTAAVTFFRAQPAAAAAGVASTTLLLGVVAFWLLRDGASVQNAVADPQVAAGVPAAQPGGDPLNAAPATSGSTDQPSEAAAVAPAKAVAAASDPPKPADRAVKQERAIKVAKPERADPSPPVVPEPELATITSSELDGSLRTVPTCVETLGNAKVEPSADEAEVMLVVLRAEKALRFGNVKGAHAVFCRAVAMAPENFRATFGLAQLLLIRRDAAAAVNWAKRAAALPSEYKRRALNVQADALVRLGRQDEARALWLEAATIAEPTPTQLDAYVNKTRVMAGRALKSRDYNRAERLYRRVLAFDPDSRQTQRKLAMALERLGEVDAARYWARKS